MGVLDHHDGGVDHGADGDGDATQAHQIGVHAQRAHGDEAISTPTGSIRMATRALRTCIRKTMQTSATMSAFLNQRPFQRVDGAVYQFGTVVHRLHRDSLRQAGTNFGYPGSLRLWMTSSALAP
jgi:hypothetical protein